MANYTMKKLINDSIQVIEGMTAVFRNGEEVFLHVSECESKFNGCYAINNSTICFVLNGNVYVTPYFKVAEKTLQENGLHRENFYVPFSNGDYPKRQKEKWSTLCQQARCYCEKEREEAWCEWADKHNIGTLFEETLENCLRIPDDGFWVKHYYYEEITLPVSDIEKHMGQFCTNNGVVVFIYRNGHTYVTKGYGIIQKLRRAGYTEGRLFVPLSNGEQIQDSSLRDEWNRIQRRR